MVIIAQNQEQTTKQIAIQGVDVLTPTGWLPEATVLIEEGKFLSIGQTQSPPRAIKVEAQGLRMLPGIVDIHGDAFERMICPRPGVSFPLAIAIEENDQNLIASGITTFFYSITDSYEPGLRSRETARAIIDLILSARQKHLRADSRIHIRHEETNTANYQELCDWLASGVVNLLSLADHLPPPGNDYKLNRHLNSLRRRLKMSELELKTLIDQAQARREEGNEQVEELVKFAHQHRVPLASHDDDTPEKVELSRTRGVAIAEFPARVELAAQCRQYGAAVLMGAPNLVRGGSHVGQMSVTEAAQQDVLDCLCSDYHYPSLFHAPFKLAEMGLLPFEQAWQLVSARPAAAAGIDDAKGSIAPGLDADFLLVNPDNSLPSAIAAVYVAGQEAARYLSR